MCIAAPGKVLSVKNRIAQILYPGDIVNQAMVIDVTAKKNDFVMVQMGVVIRILSEEEAISSHSAWKEVGSK